VVFVTPVVGVMKADKFAGPVVFTVKYTTWEVVLAPAELEADTAHM
jgi:hypothetical protein